jgi:multidrug transporter EmrE-like cation transporter
MVLIVKQVLCDGPRELVPGRLARWPGVCLGLANAGGISFMIPALREIPAAIAWPVASCCGVSATALLARFAWKEQLDTRAVIGLCLAVVVLVLVNLEKMLAAIGGG